MWDRALGNWWGVSPTMHTMPSTRSGIRRPHSTWVSSFWPHTHFLSPHFQPPWACPTLLPLPTTVWTLYCHTHFHNPWVSRVTSRPHAHDMRCTFGSHRSYLTSEDDKSIYLSIYLSLSLSRKQAREGFFDVDEKIKVMKQISSLKGALVCISDELNPLQRPIELAKVREARKQSQQPNIAKKKNSNMDLHELSTPYFWKWIMIVVNIALMSHRSQA